MTSIKVGILNTRTSCATGDTTMNSLSQDQAINKGGGWTGANTTPCMLKLLTCFCVVQSIILITTAATLGPIVNENKTKLKQLEATLSEAVSSNQLLSNMEQLLTNSQNQSARSNQLDMKMARLESEQYGNRIAELESESYYIQNNRERLKEFESEITSATESIQQNFNAISGLAYMINELKSGTGTVLNNSEMITELGLKTTLDNSFIQTVNDTLKGIDHRITDLETNTNILRNTSDRITELDLNVQSAIFLIRILNDTLEDFAEQKTELETNTTDARICRERILAIELSVESVTSIVNTHNISIINLGNQIVDLKKFTANIQNNNDIISELESDIQSVKALIQANNETSIDLEKRINYQETVSSTLQNFSDMIREFDAELRLGVYVIQTYNDTLMELRNKFNVLEKNSSDPNPTNKSRLYENVSITSVIQEYNSSLNDLGKRVLGLNTNVSDCSERIAEFKSNVDSIMLIIQTSNVSLNYLGKKIDELELEYSVIRNNSNRIADVDSDLDTATSNIEDHDTALQDVANRITAIEADVSTVYTRWGRTTCPGNSSKPVYDGYAGGSHYAHSGGAASMICLPRDPDWDAGNHNDALHSATGLLYGAEYRDGQSRNDNLFGKSHHDHDVPCVVCLVRQSSVLVIPGKSKCYDGWSLEYSGYLMSNSYQHTGATDFYCVDNDPEDLIGGAKRDDGLFLYFVEPRCGSLRCPPYVEGREFQCVVCTK